MSVESKRVILEKPREFFESLGNLHDCRVAEISWRPKDRQLRFLVEDMNSNFAGLPEYPGREPRAIAMVGLKKIEIDLAFDEATLNIYELEVTHNPSHDHQDVVLKFWPSGTLHLTCEFIALDPFAVV
jgi:hypothetical protein